MISSYTLTKPRHFCNVVETSNDKFRGETDSGRG